MRLSSKHAFLLSRTTQGLEGEKGGQSLFSLEQDRESVQDSRNGRDKQIVTILEESPQRQMGNCLQTPDVVNHKNTNIMLEITGKPLIVKKENEL